MIKMAQPKFKSRAQISKTDAFKMKKDIKKTKKSKKLPAKGDQEGKHKTQIAIQLGTKILDSKGNITKHQKFSQQSSSSSQSNKTERHNTTSQAVGQQDTLNKMGVHQSPPTAASNLQQGLTSPVNTPKKRKRKKVSKTHDGISNWEQLCSKLNMDPKRKKVLGKTSNEDEEVVSKPEIKRSKPEEVWFDNVDKILIERPPGEETQPVHSEEGTSSKLVKPDSFKGITHCVAMDCEMVGVGPQGEESILARVSIVNHYGSCLYDKFVLPQEKVTDYRTHVSGVTKENISQGEEFNKVQKEVNAIIRGKVLVGHALHNDLKVLFLTHPHKMIRDTSKYKPFRQLFKGGIPSLKKLSDKILGVSVQEGQHSSVQDAQAAMRLYTMHRQRWEKELKLIWKQNSRKRKK